MGQKMTFTAFLLTAFLLTASSTSMDCPDVINLALGLNMNTQQPAIMAQLKGDCCSATSITCVGSRVTDINWAYLNLNGAINGTALPSSLQSLNFYDNAIVGQVPSSFPSALTYIEFGQNFLNNSIPTTLPVAMTYFNVGDNSLTGPVLINWPSTLTFIDFGWNLPTGPVPTKWPSGLTYLDINLNPMTCNSQQTWPRGITFLKMNGLNCIGSNPIYPDALQTLWIGWSGDWNYYNKFSGTLILKKPTYLTT